MTTTDLYPYLIIIGSSILAATGWLLHQYRMQVLRSQKLIHLNEELAYDLPDFLRQCWPLLRDGGFSGMNWELYWFGTTVKDEYGEPGGIVLEKKFEVPEVSLTIKLHRNKKGWEQQYFSDAHADNFFLLVRMNLWIKLGTVKGAFDQTAKMTVFFKHDVKNMVQLMSLTVDQLRNTKPGHEAKLLENLRQAIPAVRDRAQHMLSALVNEPSELATTANTSTESLELDKVLEQTASIYELPVTVHGKATVKIDKDRLQSIVDNLLGNYSHQSRIRDNDSPNLSILLTTDNGTVEVCIEDTSGKPFLSPERLFEPFWSEHGTGRGIGLYQARQQANAVGGNLQARAEPDRPLQFILTLPLGL